MKPVPGMLLMMLVASLVAVFVTQVVGKHRIDEGWYIGIIVGQFFTAHVIDWSKR